jgi:hypothetical protein
MGIAGANLGLILSGWGSVFGVFMNLVGVRVSLGSDERNFLSLVRALLSDQVERSGHWEKPRDSAA